MHTRGPIDCIAECKADLGGAGAIEGVGLQDVGTRLQELIVDVSDDIRAGDDQQVVVAPQLMGMGLVPLPPEVLLSQPAVIWQLHSEPFSCCKRKLH